jgi:hypothetical protein
MPVKIRPIASSFIHVNGSLRIRNPTSSMRIADMPLIRKDDVEALFGEGHRHTGGPIREHDGDVHKKGHASGDRRTERRMNPGRRQSEADCKCRQGHATEDYIHQNEAGHCGAMIPAVAARRPAFLFPEGASPTPWTRAGRRGSDHDGASGRMSTEVEDIQRIISASGRDMLDAYRIQASVEPVTDKALEEILFRAAHGVVQSLATYTRDQRAALLPSVVRMLLATFIEETVISRQNRTQDT